MGKREQTLIKKTVIYAFGNFGSKILSYLMVLVYSYFINTKDLGYYDLVITTISMVLPVIIFGMNDGIYRFLVDSDDLYRKRALGSSFKFLCFTVFVSEGIFGLLNRFYSFDYFWWIALYLFSLVFYTYFTDAIRGLGNSKFYALVGVINSLLLLSSEIICLIFLHLGVLSLLVSKVVANIFSIIIIFLRQKELRYILFYETDNNIMKQLLFYSAPLIPNAICWWCVNSSDRYIILHYLGSGYNGIYSMANKFPTIIATLTSIFYLAWQESAIKEYNSTNRDNFFSEVFEKYFILLFSFCLCAIPATKIILNIFLADSYKIAWRYTGFLYLGATFSAFCSFLGIGYQISKETNRSINTTIISAAINIIVNITLIKFIGLQAASVSTFIAYFLLFAIRISHTKKYFTLKIEWELFIGLSSLCLAAIFITIFVDSWLISILLFIISLAMGFILNKKLVAEIVNHIKNFKKKTER